MTAHAMIGDEQRCIDAGMDAYLAKPLRRDRLAAALEQVTSSGAGGRARAGAAGTRAGPAATAPIDAAALLETLDGDQALLAKLCSLLLESLPAMQSQLRAAVEAGDPADAARAAHALRGAIASFHARGSIEALAALETAAAEGHVERLAAELARVDAEIARAAAAAREMSRLAA